MGNMNLFTPFKGIKNAAKDIKYPVDGPAGSVPAETLQTAVKDIATIKADLNTASTGLKAKVATIESDLNTASTGLKARVTALEQA